MVPMQCQLSHRDRGRGKWYPCSVNCNTEREGRKRKRYLAASIVTQRGGWVGGGNGTHAVSIVTQGGREGRGNCSVNVPLQHQLKHREGGREGEMVPLLCLVNCNVWTPPNEVSNVISMDVCTTN